MARTKSLTHYPTRYLEIVRECAIEGKITRVTLPDIKRGLSLRGHWYAFVGALKAEAARIKREASVLITAGEEDIRQVATLAPRVMVQLEASEDGQCSVIWQSRDHSWQAQALREAVTTQSQVAPTAKGVEDIASRLMRIQQEVNDGESK